ncbi:MAG: hypothetical protein IPH35_26535 [Rhodoferax sp.]|nr:hypothetical protein [Rhodoferax sp.]
MATATAKTALVKCANASNTRQHDAIKTAGVDAATTPSGNVATAHANAAFQSLLQKK